MGTTWLTVSSVLILVVQASHVACRTCIPGFDSDIIIFKVPREQLMQGMRLGKVNFTDCTDRTTFHFTTDDEYFMVLTDGMLVVKRHVRLHEGRRDFYIHSWDSQGHKLTVPVMVVHHVGHHHQDHHHNADHHHGDDSGQAEQHPSKVDSSNNTETAAGENVSIIYFPKSVKGLRRRKRDWVIPPMTVQEGSRGPFPQRIVQIRSSEDKAKKIYYSITGPAADEGIFTIDRISGFLYVTQPLDRERQASYTFMAHAVAEGSGKAEDSMEIIVRVGDQNDNAPVFTQSTYLGEVAEASPVGHEVLQVTATDLDEPNNLNSIIRYSIVSQTPKKPSDKTFVINEVTGMIRVNEGGLDREIIPQYDLVVRAADGEGRWLSSEAKVILKVTDSNDHAPQFTQNNYEATVADNKQGAVVLKMEVTDYDEPHTPAWNTKFWIVDGDPGNLFTVETGHNKQEGILKLAKDLETERSSKHTLLVTVKNEVPFAVPLPTSTATVVVNCVSRQDLLPSETGQNVMCNIKSDPAGRPMTVSCLMSSNSQVVAEGKYTAHIVDGLLTMNFQPQEPAR